MERVPPDFVLQLRESALSFRFAHEALSAEMRPSGEVGWQFGNDIWNTRLLAYGRGSKLKTLNPVKPTPDANRVEYRYANLTEWYVNGPLGLEQGFTLTARPNHAAGKPLTLALALSGSLTASVDPARNSLALTKNGTTVLHSGELTALDSQGRELRAWLDASNNQLLIHVSDQGAQYPITIDPYIQIVSLTACDSQPTDWFGWSAAISADGSTLVVGAPFAQVQLSTSVTRGGAAYVFVKSAKFGWNTLSAEEADAKLVGSQPTFRLGWSVSISDDGGTIAVSDEAGDIGVFLQPSTGWAQESLIFESADLGTPPNPVLACSISGDGNTIAAGDNTGDYGSAYVFVKPSAGWASTNQPNAQLSESAPSEFFDSLGQSISVSGDGSTVVVGAPFWDDLGSAYVFIRAANGWSNMTQTAQLIPTDWQFLDEIGFSVRISSDASTVVVGAPASYVNGNFAPGKAYIFTRPANGWGDETETAKVTASDGTVQFGWDVTTNSNGSFIGVVAAYIAYVFSEPPTGWA